jgi:hypothetical protein
VMNEDAPNQLTELPPSSSHETKLEQTQKAPRRRAWIVQLASVVGIIVSFLVGLGSLVLGVIGFFIWSQQTRQWPFAPAQKEIA